MASPCPLCGATFTGSEQCQNRYHRFLALELEDPAYGIVHNLTVPAYTLQHNGYSRQGWLWSRALLAQFVREGVGPAEARRDHRRELDSGNRDWSITQGPKPEWFDEIVWSRTIADVRYDDDEDYRADVRAWAAAVLDDTDAVVAELDLSAET